MKKRLLYLVLGVAVLFFGPAGAALAHDHGHESDHGDHGHDGDHPECNNDDHHGGDSNHHDGDRSHTGASGHDGDHEGDDGDDDDNNSCQSVCPCVTALPLFATAVSGKATVTDCVDTATGTFTSIVTSVGTLVTDSGAMPYCSLGASPPFISLTAAQALTCRALLRQVAASKGVVCHAAPE